jgi:hypothetical protein
MDKTAERWLWLLPLISGGIVLGCLVYCRLWWTPVPMGIGDPDCSVVCWMFCSTMNNFWFALGVLFSFISLHGSVMMLFNMRRARMVTLVGGLLILPSGLLNLIAFYYKKS